MDETRKILCVDDESFMRLIYGRLSSLAHVVTCSDGKEALQVLRSDASIGLVFTDNNMPPGESGLYLLEKSRDIVIPKYMVSSPIGITEKALNDQVRGYNGLGLIVKPFDTKFLQSVARETLASGASATYEAYARENRLL